MKGGYQILDLTGATAGSPVVVKGIYKAAAGNNGKPVLILTNDGQRVYAEIAEDDGDYITCYISAEGKTVNITIEPDDSVTTVISDPGASITGLEQAVNELNDNKAAKSDITDLECTGTKNTTGNTIAAGRYFYLNGALCKATADIANNATFTLNTNFTVVTIDEELSALNSKLIKSFDITGLTTNERGNAVCDLPSNAHIICAYAVISNSWYVGTAYERTIHFIKTDATNEVPVSKTISSGLCYYVLI